MKVSSSSNVMVVATNISSQTTFDGLETVLQRRMWRLFYKQKAKLSSKDKSLNSSICPRRLVIVSLVVNVAVKADLSCCTVLSLTSRSQ